MINRVSIIKKLKNAQAQCKLKPYLCVKFFLFCVSYSLYRNLPIKKQKFSPVSKHVTSPQQICKRFGIDEKAFSNHRCEIHSCSK